MCEFLPHAACFDHMRSLTLACTFACALALLVGSAAAEAKTPPRPKGGVWSGPTAQGFRIDFRVSRGRKPKKVAPLTADFRLRCNDGSRLERNLSTKVKAPVVRGKFFIVLTLVPNNLITGGKAKFVGRFRSRRRARGRASERLNLRDGRTCDSRSVKWKAKFRRRR
jgi:hypothetical protein